MDLLGGAPDLAAAGAQSQPGSGQVAQAAGAEPDGQAGRDEAAAVGEVERWMESLPVGLLGVGPGGRVLLANGAFRGLFAHVSVEPVGRMVTDLLPLDCLHDWAAGGGGAQASPGHLCTMVGPGGSPQHLRVSITGCRPTDRHPELRALAWVCDVTGETSARAERDDMRRTLGSVLDQLDEAVVLSDVGGTVTGFNRAAAELFGVSRQELGEATLADLLRPASKEQVLDAMGRYVRTGDTACFGATFVLDGVRPDGEVLPVEARLTACPGARDLSFVLVMRDVSGRMEHELRLAQSQRSLLMALDRLPELAAIAVGGDVAYVNDALVTALGAEGKGSLVGAPLASVVHPSDRDGFCAHLANVQERGQAAAAVDVRFVGAGGPPLASEVAAIPIEFRDQPAVLLLGRDLSERRQRESQAMQEDRMVAVGTLAAGIAHEINTPIQFISDSVHFLQEASGDVFGLVEALQRLRRAVIDGADAAHVQELLEDVAEMEEQADLEYLEEHVPAAFGRVVEGVERVSTIVRSMKEFSHPSSGEREPFDLNRAVEMTVTIARNEYKYVADLVLELGDLPPVQGFPDEVNQVILNLVVNAAHAMASANEGTDRRGTLTVRTRAEGDAVVLEVEDTGTGIPEGLRERIFEPFFTTKEVGKGTGQGLALAWRVVTEHHGGQIRVESEVGKGTTFMVRLPVAGGGAAPEEQAP